MSTLLQGCVCLIALAAPEAPARLPTFEEVVAGLAASEAKVENLSVRTDYVKVDAFLHNPPLRLEMTAVATVDKEGRLAYVVTGEQGAGGGKIYRGQWRGTYDGKAFRSLDGNENGQFHFGGIDRHWSMHGLHPLEFTAGYVQKSIAQDLKDKGGSVVGAVQIQGRNVVLVEMPPIKSNELRKVQFWVDPERWVVVKRAITRKPAGHDWHEYTRLETSEYAEVKPGIWLPGKVKQESLDLDLKTGKDNLSWSFEGTNHAWKINQMLPAGTFELVFPDGIKVTDRR